MPTRHCLPHALAAAAAALLAAATPLRAQPADPSADADRHAALQAFSEAYGLAQAWPRMVPKIAQDSLPRLRARALADIAADPLPDADARGRAAARVDTLLPAARGELESALRTLDADELAAFTAFEVYARLFETEEIKALTAFFGSPTGRKLNAEAPAVLAESRRPGAKDVMARHFGKDELREIAAFWSSPAGMKMARTADTVRDQVHEHFMARSEAALQEVARRVANAAEGEPAAASAMGAATR